MTTLHHRGDYDEAIESFHAARGGRANRPARGAGPTVAPTAAPADEPVAADAVADVGGEWDDLLADVARTRPAPGDSVDHADGGDLLPTCCLTGILGGVGSLIVFGSAAAIPCLVAAAAGTVLGVVVARA